MGSWATPTPRVAIRPRIRLSADRGLQWIATSNQARPRRAPPPRLLAPTASSNHTRGPLPLRGRERPPPQLPGVSLPLPSCGASHESAPAFVLRGSADLRDGVHREQGGSLPGDPLLVRR